MEINTKQELKAWEKKFADRILASAEKNAGDRSYSIICKDLGWFRDKITRILDTCQTGRIPTEKSLKDLNCAGLISEFDVMNYTYKKEEAKRFARILNDKEVKKRRAFAKEILEKDISEIDITETPHLYAWKKVKDYITEENIKLSTLAHRFDISTESIGRFRDSVMKYQNYSLNVLVALEGIFTKEELAILIFERTTNEIRENKSDVGGDEYFYLVNWAQNNLPDWYRKKNRERRNTIGRQAIERAYKLGISFGEGL